MNPGGGGGGGYSPIKVSGLLVGKFREHPLKGYENLVL